MIKLWVCVLSVLIGAWVLEPLPAEGACSQSRIDVGVERLVIGGTVPVAWTINPPCDVIETGLILGTEPAVLMRVGEPIHGFRNEYHQFLTVGESRPYWVAAYALDEEGALIQSAPEIVLVAIPPQTVAASALSPLAPDPDPPLPPATAADFLRPQPLASLARAERIAEHTDILLRFPCFLGCFQLPPGGEITGSASHMLASISRDEVQAGLGALKVADFTINIDPTLVSGALDVLDQGFAEAGFPRTGLYAVECQVSIGRTPSGLNMVTSGPSCFPDVAGVVPTRFGGGGLRTGVGYRNDQRDQNDAFFEAHHFQTTQSAANYFIPRPDPGQRLVSARFESFLSVSGDPSTVTINGQRPQIDTPFTCFGFPEEGGLTGCFGFASWDLTADAVARIGGEMPLTFDPNPPGFEGTRGFEQVRFNGYGVHLAVNYPWATLDPFNGVLRLTFQQTCPKQLNMTVTPASVRPSQAGAAQPSTVTVFVHTCPPATGGGPASVDVTLEVQAPHPGEAGDGGHRHGERPPTAFGTLDGQKTVPCTAPIDADGMGLCTFTYQPSEVSGVETILATATGFGQATAQVTVQVPGVVELPEDPTRYVLVGAPQNHAGTNDPCRETAPSSRHFQNHFGQPRLNKAVGEIADTMVRETGILLRVNDMSLPLGGLFDIRNNWSTPHKGHRVGREADIGFKGIRNGVCTPYDPDLLFTVIENATGRRPLIEDGAEPHFHARLP